LREYITGIFGKTATALTPILTIENKEQLMKRIFIIVILASLPLLTIVLIKGKEINAQGKTEKTDASRKVLKYPTMLDMTFPEFEAAAKKTDVMLLPIGSIEEHGSHLPLDTDAVEANAQVFYVQNYLREKGFETIIGPPLNIGITNEADDRARRHIYVSGKFDRRKRDFCRPLSGRFAFLARQRNEPRFSLQRTSRRATFAGDNTNCRGSQPKDRRIESLRVDGKRATRTNESKTERRCFVYQKRAKF
jgi:hypothetical protein